MTITRTLPDELILKIITGIMENFPEASSGCALQCTGWKYKTLEFDFVDAEDGRKFEIGKESLLKAFALMFTDKWPRGCTPLPSKDDWETWEDWLCQADATDFDAFAQLACLGEVIYG